MEPQRLSASHGWQWIKQGITLFMKAPLRWIVISSIFTVVAPVALTASPVAVKLLLSLLLESLFMSVILAGLMAGCRALQQGERLSLTHLFSGFQRHTSQLIMLGSITLVNSLIIHQVIAVGPIVARLVTIILPSILSWAMLFAPMLVFFNDTPPVAAIKLSLRACFRNILPMLVYGILTLILVILFYYFMSFISFVFVDKLFGNGVAFLFGFVMPITSVMLSSVVLMPVWLTSLYAAYSDIFPPAQEVSSAS